MPTNKNDKDRSEEERERLEQEERERQLEEQRKETLERQAREQERRALEKENLQLENLALLREQNQTLQRAMESLVENMRETLIKEKKKIPPPLFRGKIGEDPHTHMLRAKDWLECEEVPAAEWTYQFRLTLDGRARDWFHDTTIHDWKDCKEKFLKQFSKYGRSDKQLHQKWRSLSFEPATDNILEFIKDVRQTALQMGYNEEAMVSCIKSCMPENVNIALYNTRDLDTVTDLLADIYHKVPTYKLKC